MCLSILSCFVFFLLLCFSNAHDKQSGLSLVSDIPGNLFLVNSKTSNFRNVLMFLSDIMEGY